ncbi:MAG: 4Fe-4S dicluster domain-containing protein [Bacteroidetes bacterium]|nr:4Fe-4S dicluster domain-containing protein [Bacteroidota bacterium]
MHWLKVARVTSSLFVGSALTLVFLDVFHAIPLEVVTALVGTQLGPAILESLSNRVLQVIVVVLFIATLLFGRVYCSTLCPLGLLQDLFGHIPVWKDKRNKRRYRFVPPYFKTQYSIFTVVLVSAIAGSYWLLNMLEPYSVYGRIIVTLGVPTIVGVNNVLAVLLGTSEIVYRHFTWGTFGVTSSLLVFIAILSYTKGRLFCNLLCPVGTLLGLVSRFSFFKISIVQSLCKDCGACEKVCKARCIDAREKKVEFAACVGCFNCIDVCPTAGIMYVGRKMMKTKTTKVKNSRRNFLKATFLTPIVASVATVVQKLGAQETRSRYFEARTIPVTPPGSRSVRHFSRHCTACYLCVEQCPTQVLVPATMQYGMSGLFQPRLDYSVSYCNYDCTICSHVCPTGAISPLSVEQKRVTQIGVAEFIADDCIVKVKQKDCGACSEHCPTKAVRMVPYGELFIPEMHSEYCIGCGACEHVCPAEPRKAIYVVPHSVHKVAKEPTFEEYREEKPLEDFPF